MYTCPRRLLAMSLVALLATLGTTAAQAKIMRNGTQADGTQQPVSFWRIAKNGTQTNGQVNATAAKAPNRGTQVAPQAATITLPNGTTLPLR